MLIGLPKSSPDSVATTTSSIASRCSGDRASTSGRAALTAWVTWSSQGRLTDRRRIIRFGSRDGSRPRASNRLGTSTYARPG